MEMSTGVSLLRTAQSLLTGRTISAFHARPLCIVYCNVCVIVCIVLLCVSVFYVLSSPSFHPLLMPGNNM